MKAELYKLVQLKQQVSVPEMPAASREKIFGKIFQVIEQVRKELSLDLLLYNNKAFADHHNTSVQTLFTKVCQLFPF